MHTSSPLDVQLCANLHTKSKNTNIPLKCKKLIALSIWYLHLWTSFCTVCPQKLFFAWTTTPVCGLHLTGDTALVAQKSVRACKQPWLPHTHTHTQTQSTYLVPFEIYSLLIQSSRSRCSQFGFWIWVLKILSLHFHETLSSIYHFRRRRRRRRREKRKLEAQLAALFVSQSFQRNGCFQSLCKNHSINGNKPVYMNQAAAQITYRKQGPFSQPVTPLALSPALFFSFFWSCCLRWHFFRDVQPKLEIIAQTQLWPVRLQMMTESNNLRGLMHQSVKKAHLLSSATLLSPGGKSPPVMFTPAQAHRSPLSSLLSDIDCGGFFLFPLLCLCTWPIHSISSTTLNTTQICTVQPFPFSMILSLTCLLPPLLPNQSPVDSEVLKTISQSPALLASFLSCLSLLLLFSPSSLPLTFHSYPLSVLSLPLINPLPLPNYYKFSLTHYLLLAPRLPPPLLLIPSLSIAVSAYPPYISSAFALLSPHLQRHEYIIIYTMGPCLLFMNYQPCGQTKPIFIRNLHFISAPIRLGAKE